MAQFLRQAPKDEDYSMQELQRSGWDRSQADSASKMVEVELLLACSFRGRGDSD